MGQCTPRTLGLPHSQEGTVYMGQCTNRPQACHTLRRVQSIFVDTTTDPNPASLSAWQSTLVNAPPDPKPATLSGEHSQYGSMHPQNTSLQHSQPGTVNMGQCTPRPQAYNQSTTSNMTLNYESVGLAWSCNVCLPQGYI